MKLFRGLDPFQATALLLLSAPAVGVVLLGLYALWRSPNTLWWLAGFVLSAIIGYALQQWCVRRDRRLLAEAVTEPDPEWPPEADEVWQRVDAMAEALEPDDWPLDDGNRLWMLGRRTLETVAHAYHPETERPLLELTVPHALLIIERASRDLRADIIEHVPFSHRLTIGDLLRVQRWKEQAEKAYDLYRAGRVVINPLDALIGEAWRQLRNRSFGLARFELHRWLLRAYVRKVGFYAIDLYSGRLPLDEVGTGPVLKEHAQSSSNPAAETHDTSEPLSILVLGRTGAGKSSLINALFGRLTAATDVLSATTTGVTAYALEREGFTPARVFDTPGFDGEGIDLTMLQERLDSADLVLWVSMVTRADRAQELTVFRDLRLAASARRNRRPPPFVVVATGIDRLRPASEWSPPYDLESASRPKSASIRAAVAAIAVDLDVPLSSVVPVCLAEGREYNVDDGLWSSLLAVQDEALRARLLRCLEARRRKENWQLLSRQLRAAGRLLGEVPERVVEHLRR